MLHPAADAAPHDVLARGRALYYINWPALFEGDPTEALQAYGHWCGGPECGMTNCCDGGPCTACVADAEELLPEGGAACLAECPPRDAVDALCMRHDFCVSAMLHRLGGWSNCSYHTPGGLVTVPANECSCDKALYDGVAALGGDNGFKGNLLTWLGSSWGRCLETDAAHVPGACVPFRGAVSPPLVHAPRSDHQRLAAGLGAATGALLPLGVWAAASLCRRSRAGRASSSSQATSPGDIPLLPS